MAGKKKEFSKRKYFDKRYVALERRKSRVMIFVFLWSLIFIWIIKNFVLSLEVVEGRSMYPTLKDGDFYIMNKYVYFFTNPKREDVVAVKNSLLEKDQLIKRVVGIPGDLIKIKHGKVYLNGDLLDEPYVEGETKPDIDLFKVREGTYFVMGDNREISDDSRFFGCVEVRQIRGKLALGKVFTFK